MKSLVIAAAALGMVLAGDAAEARRRTTYSVPRASNYSTTPRYTYTYPTTSYYRSQPQRMGFFESIMEFERRKNEFIFGR